MTKETGPEGMGLEISPCPSSQDQEVILAALRNLLQREAHLAQPAVWRVAGWSEGQRAGITDVSPRVGSERRWPLSSRLAWGGRPFAGMSGRGEAK